MTPVFLDTSGLIALINDDDQWHRKAEAIWSELVRTRRRLVTTSLVLIECGDGLSRLHQRRAVVELRETLRSMVNLTIVQTVEALEDRAWTLYQDRTDKDWGMTDCVSMTVMWDDSITEVFGLDRHFQQAGFQLLLS
jgi:predicted nucleic acid-binding protein